MQMTKDALDHIEAHASSAPIWMLNHYIKLVRYGLEGVSQEVNAQADALLLKLNGLAENEAIRSRPSVSTPPVYLDATLSIPQGEPLRKAA